MNHKFNYAVEIGAGDSSSSILLKSSSDKILLIEPNKLLFDDLNNYIIHNQLDIGIKNIAISELNHEQNLFNFGYCSFLEGKPSFLKLSCEDGAEQYWKPRISKCECINFNNIDNGNIDYLVLTANGSELEVLKNIISRPQIIKTKYYCHNQQHWLYYNQISDWMQVNNYKPNILRSNTYQTFFEIDFIKS
jgi:hypothetical protein